MRISQSFHEKEASRKIIVTIYQKTGNFYLLTFLDNGM